MEQRSIEIALVAHEWSPHTGSPHSGGHDLGAYARSLRQELTRRGHRVVVFAPFRKRATSDAPAGVRYQWVDQFDVTLGEQTRQFRIHEVVGGSTGGPSDPDVDPGADVQLADAYGPGCEDVHGYLIENEDLFERDEFVLDAENDAPWPDNAERFGFFAQSVLVAMQRLKWAPEVLHANDLPASLLPLLCREQPGLPDAFRTMATVYGIHDLREQGVYSPGALAWVPVSTRLADALGPLEFFDQVNFVKAGLLYADEITAPSPRAARLFLENPKAGRGLQGVLSDRGRHLTGILTGIDAETWNPAHDELLPYGFSQKSLQGKANNKIRLLETLELPVEPDVALFVMWGPLRDGHGFELFESLGGDLLGERLKWAVLGRGDAAHETRMRELYERFPHRFAYVGEVAEPMRHLAFAGADVSVAIDSFDPSGKSEMRAHRYATVPMTHASGGVPDVAVDYVLDSGKGNAFMLADYTPEAFFEAVQRALTAYERKRSWKKLVTQLLQKDYSWERVAREYENVYHRALHLI